MTRIMNALSRQIDRDVYKAHRRWLDAGCDGDGRLELEGEILLGFTASALDLTGAKLTSCNLGRGNLSNTTLASAELVSCVFTGVDLYMTDFRRARLVGCTLSGSRMSLARLDEATLEDCDLSETAAQRLLFSSTDVRSCRFDRARLTDATFDRSELSRCSFRDASLSRRAGWSDVLGRARGSTFEDCDFRGVDWSGFRISGCAFRRCSFAGGVGAPAVLEELTIADADVSPDPDRFVERWRSGAL